MDTTEAQDLFRELESARYAYHDGEEAVLYPVYEVRWDVGIDENERRTQRVFVRVAAGVEDTRAAWADVVTIAERADADLKIENNGIELR